MLQTGVSGTVQQAPSGGKFWTVSEVVQYDSARQGNLDRFPAAGQAVGQPSNSHLQDGTIASCSSTGEEGMSSQRAPYSGPEVAASEITICRRPNGEPYLLGADSSCLALDVVVR